MFWRKRKPSDFSAEVEAHLALEIGRLKKQGMSEKEARAAARLSCGSDCSSSLRMTRFLPSWQNQLTDEPALEKIGRSEPVS